MARAPFLDTCEYMGLVDRKNQKEDELLPRDMGTAGSNKYISMAFGNKNITSRVIIWGPPFPYVFLLLFLYFSWSFIDSIPGFPPQQQEAFIPKREREREERSDAIVLL